MQHSMTQPFQRGDAQPVLTYVALAPLADLEWQLNSPSNHTLAIAETPDQEAIGTATSCLSIWGGERGLAGLYGITAGESYQGLFVLVLPEKRFTPYSAWMRCANLLSEPQNALDALASIESLKGRHLVCVVRRKHQGNMIGVWQTYAKRPYWKDGRYEGWYSPSFVDAIYAVGRAHPHYVMIPLHIANLSPRLHPYPGYVEIHFDVRRRSVGVLMELLPDGARWVGSYDGFAQIRFDTADPTVLNAVLTSLQEQWGVDKFWVPEWRNAEDRR